MLDEPYGSRRFNPEFLRFLGILTIAVAGACTAAAAVQLLRPARLVLAPNGLTYSWLWIRQEWSWSEVGPFLVDGGFTSRMIRFEVSSHAPKGGPISAHSAIPGGWRVGIGEVCRQLNAARERWR